MIREICVALFLISGGILSLVAAVGLLRFPDLFTRMHATAKVGTVGISAITVGLITHFGTVTVTSRGLIVIAFFLLTAPVAANMIGRSAYRAGVSLWILTRIDEWKTHGDIGKVDETGE